ncbi:troponin I, cardiac muscle-like, partial [Polyodon spathula]|uniref:troponin I, cardiac muscle-like n=1 Tax=Polyodon spathula TaxID=7913 RepID=UPI001B7D9AD6
MADQGEGVQRQNKMSSSRKLQLKRLALAVAQSLRVEQEVMRSRERERFLQESCQPLETQGLETSEIQVSIPLLPPVYYLSVSVCVTGSWFVHNTLSK